MSVQIKTPNITAATDRERLQQIQSYLYRMANQLQWAFDHLQTGTVPVQPAVKHATEITAARLRRCCSHAMTTAHALDQRCADPEYGPVYQLLAQRQRENWLLLLEIIGSGK